MDKALATGSRIQTCFVDPIVRQVEILKQKGCNCDVGNLKTEIMTNQVNHFFNVHMARASSLVIVLMIAALWGCAVKPSETTLAGAIADYFENSRYKVVDLKIGKIEGMPLSQKTYMGTSGYVVDVVSITLEPKEDKGVDIKKGKLLNFSNASIRVTQDRINKNMWHVSIISGIGVP